MVRYAEPSKLSDVPITQRRKRANSSRDGGPLPHLRNSSQALLMESHISMVSAVRTARVEARGFDAIADRGWIVGGEGEEFRHRLLVSLRIGGEERFGAAGGGDCGFPFVGFAHIGERQRGQPQRGVEDARQIFRALAITGERVKVIGGARQHRSIRPIPKSSFVQYPNLHSSNTQIFIRPI